MPRSNIHIAIIGVAAEGLTTTLQFLVKVVEQDI